MGCVCTGALTHVGVCSRVPRTGGNTNVPHPPPRRHLCNRCTYHKPCVTPVNSVVSKRYSCVCFSCLFCFSMFGGFCLFVVRLIRCIFVFNFPFSSLLLFMKLEHLKDCCVFVNNKSSVALRACKVPRPAATAAHVTKDVVCVPCPPSSPPLGVNVWDQTLFSGCAQVTLTTHSQKKHPAIIVRVRSLCRDS